MLTFKSKPNPSDIAALICDIIMLVIFLWDQLRYGMNMLFLIIPLAAIGVYLVLSGIIPHEYRFTDKTLEIRRILTRAVIIPYDSVFNYEATRHDSFMNIGFSSKVKLYYELNEKKSAVICRPKDAEGFVDALKARCAELHYETPGSSIDVFFKEKDK